MVRTATALGLTVCLFMLAGVASSAPTSAPILAATTPPGLSRPHDLVLSPDGKLLYVSDVGNHEVKVYRPDSLKIVGALGTGVLDSPHDVAFDSRGRLLVADTGNSRVAIFELKGISGRLVGELTAGLSAPEGVSAGQDGTIYVGDTAANTVSAFRGDSPPQVVGRRGSGELEFIRPHDVEMDSRGRLLVADPGNNRIQVLDGKLKYVRSLGGKGLNFREPKYVNVDGQHRIWVADQHNNRIVLLSKQGRPELRIPSPALEKQGVGLNLPEGVMVRGRRVWVSDTYNHRVLLFKLAGGEK